MKTVEFKLVHGVNIPWIELDDWQRRANPYTATIEYNGKMIETPYFTGSGWKTEPTWKDVLGSLFSDASCFEGSRDFEDFCNDLGYDVDSIKHRKIYQACRRIALELKDVFGPDYEEMAEYLQEEGY